MLFHILYIEIRISLPAKCQLPERKILRTKYLLLVFKRNIAEEIYVSSVDNQTKSMLMVWSSLLWIIPKIFVRDFALNTDDCCHVVC